jgi:TolB-like protein
MEGRKMKKTIMILFVIVSIMLNTTCFSKSTSRTKANKEKMNTPTVYCVAPLSNNTGDKPYDALAEGFADMLAVALSEQKTVKVVERHRLSDLLNEQKISLLGLTDPATAVKIGNLLKADRILIGGITKPKEKLIINIHAYEIQTARLITSEQKVGKATDIFNLTNDLIDNLCKKLNVQLESIDPNNIDKNPNASLHFMRGLGFYYAGNYDRAIVSFMKTQDLDPISEKAGLWMALCFVKNKEYEHALIELEDLLVKFPKSSLRQDTQEMIRICRKHHPPQQ